MTAPAPDDRDTRLANALADFVDLEAHGETVDLDEFCRNRSDLSPELRRQLETLSEIAHETRPAREIPDRLSGHKVLDEIGSGGMGRVFLAFDERLGRRVAIKMLANRYWDNSQLRTRFMKEARALARLSHPNVVHIHNLGPPDEPPHFVMEHVDGVPITLAAKALTLQQRAEIMHKVAMATEFLHQNQVIHRDLKPGNILVGSDLQPKLLDFGLALQVEERDRLTLPGDLMGTPQYFSPEQARADSPLDARSDVFSLGIVLYELLTGVLPFRAVALTEQLRTICETDPVLPRRLNPSVPGDLQNICMKALEKNPADRYGSAREMAADLERFLRGEETLAAPSSYSRLMSGRMEQHLRDLEGWRQDRMISESEYDGVRKRYDRLVDREDAWIMQVRRLTSSQVTLYLGGWLLVVATALLVLFDYPGLRGTPKAAVAFTTAAFTGIIGLRRWKSGNLRIGIAELLAFCLLLPIALLVAAGEYSIFSGLTHGNEKLEFFRKFSFERPTNAQFWWALMLSLPVYVWLRRLTRSSVFSLVFAVMAGILSMVTLLRMGMLEWEASRLYPRLIPIALVFFAAGMLIERLRYSADSRYFYPVAVTFTLIALTGIAADHEGYRLWLKQIAPWTRDQQVEYLFMINAGIYFALQAVCDWLPWAQLHAVARVFRFAIPGHVLWPLLLLGIHASDQTLEAKIFQILLPCVACVFVFTSVPKQMKNFFVWGMSFLAVGIVRLQQCLFKESRTALVIDLLVSGAILMLCAANYGALKATLGRMFQRNPSS